MAPAVASMIRRWASSGTDRRQPLPVPSSGRTALSSTARRSAQRVAEPCGSASTRTVCCPESADCAAIWVAIVVLPTTHLEMDTNTVFMRFLRTDEQIREGKLARRRPLPPQTEKTGGRDREWAPDY